MLSGKSHIYTLSNLETPRTLEELAHCDTLPEPVFSFDGVRITVGWLERVIHCGRVSVHDLIFDNHDGLVVTADQRLLLFNGDPVTLEEGVIGKSLLPLYLDRDKHGYPIYRENTGYHLNANTEADCQKTRKVARMVAENKLSSRLVSNTYVKHVDGNRYNCHPDNLAVTQKSGAKQRKFVHPFVKAVIDAQKIIESHPKNHKVVEILSGESVDVYGCIVSPMNNMAVNGVFVQTADDE